eukprot:403340541
MTMSYSSNEEEDLESQILKRRKALEYQNSFKEQKDEEDDELSVLIQNDDLNSQDCFIEGYNNDSQIQPHLDLAKQTSKQFMDQEGKTQSTVTGSFLTYISGGPSQLQNNQDFNQTHQELLKAQRKRQQQRKLRGNKAFKSQENMQTIYSAGLSLDLGSRQSSLIRNGILQDQGTISQNNMHVTTNNSTTQPAPSKEEQQATQDSKLGQFLNQETTEQSQFLLTLDRSKLFVIYAVILIVALVITGGIYMLVLGVSGNQGQDTSSFQLNYHGPYSQDNTNNAVHTFSQSNINLDSSDFTKTMFDPKLKQDAQISSLGRLD